MKRFILTLEGAVPVVRIEELHIWAKGGQCHRVERGDNCLLSLGGMSECLGHKSSASTTANAHHTFKGPPGMS